MKPYVLLALLHFLCLSAHSQSIKNFSKNDILEDLSYLKESLETAHFDLYKYKGKKEFEKNFKQVQAKISADSISELQTITLFQQVVSKVDNGHTEIQFPASAYTAYAYEQGTLFPLELAFEEGKALIRKNWSENQAIHVGDELLRINGTPIEEILQKIYPQVSAERLYFKLAKIELTSFPRLYWQVFGRVDDFEVEIKSDESVETIPLKSVPLIEGFEMKRDEIFTRENSLDFIEGNAYLKIGSFTGDEKAYQSFIDSAFTVINKKKSPNLIIDLRNNDGGNDSFSDYLVSYFADQPFRWNDTYYLKTSKLLKDHIRNERDTSQAFWASALNHPDGSVYVYDFGTTAPQAEEKRFKGEVYVLVNRQSHSQSTVAAAQIQDYGFAKIVGEETGEAPSLLASVFYITLPNTGVMLQLSKGYSIRVNGDRSEKGVIPDLFIRDHLLDEKDEILEGLLNILKRN